MTEHHSLKLVKSHDLVCILQTVLYFTDRHFTDWPILGIISEVKALCTTCVDYAKASSEYKKVIPPHHCHCSVAPISEQMKETCKNMWNANQTRLDEKNEAIQVDKEKVKAIEEDFTKRKLLFVTSLKTRSTFYAPALMTQVFEEENKKPKTKNLKESSSSTSLKKSKESCSLASAKKSKESCSLASAKKSKESCSLASSKKSKESCSLASSNKRKESSSSTSKGLTKESSSTSKELMKESSSAVKNWRDALGKRKAASPLLDYKIPKKAKKNSPAIPSSDSLDSDSD